MLTVHPQFVVDGKHRKKAVIVSLDEWKQIVEALEELDDIQSYDSAKESEPEKIPFEQAVHDIGKPKGRLSKGFTRGSNQGCG